MSRRDFASAAAVATRLDDDTVHVWRLAYERQHGREPLLALLAVYLRRPANELQLVEGAHGRPELVAANGLSFNWSHCDDRAVVAIARDIVPGIDLERLRPRPRALDIARRYFAADEIAMLEALQEDSRDEVFLRLWTAKEAVLKALGHGIAFGLHRLSFDVVKRIPIMRWLDEGNVDAWQLRALEIDAVHLCALAWQGRPRQIELHTFQPDD
jgi:4'-phosphopantetheinyl transferase